MKNILFGLVLIYLAYGGLETYFTGNSSEITEIEKLQESGVKTTAYLEDEYFEINGIKTIDYSFNVSGTPYEGSYEFKSEKEISSQEVEVFYLEEDPKINGINLETQLGRAKQEGKSTFYLIFGILFGLGGIFLIYAGLALRRTKS